MYTDNTSVTELLTRVHLYSNVVYYIRNLKPVSLELVVLSAVQTIM